MKNLEHYFICMKCANDKGGSMPEDAVNTVHGDICPYCGVHRTLWATSDFNWSDGTKAEWD